MNLDYIRGLIGDAKLKEALTTILELLDSSDKKTRKLRDSVIIIQSKYQELKRQETLGLTDLEDVQREKAQISDALLSLITDIETASVPAPENEPGNRRKSWWWALLVIPAGVLVAFLFFADGEKGAPVAEFSMENNGCQAPCTVQFNNLSQNADSFQWTFGDGGSSTEKNPVYKFQREGTYSVALIASKGKKSKTVTNTVTVVPRPMITPPIRVTVVPTQNTFSRPALQSPEEGAVLDNGCTNREDRIIWSFDWADFPNAVRYQVWVQGQNALNPVVDKVVNTSNYDHRSGGYITDGNRRGWKWRVRAQMAGGNWTDWSAERHFDVEPLNTDCR